MKSKVEIIIARIRNGDFYGNCYECNKYFLEEDFIDYLNELEDIYGGNK